MVGEGDGTGTGYDEGGWHENSMGHEHQMEVSSQIRHQKKGMGCSKM